MVLGDGGYARYDYAWKTAGWTVQNPAFSAAGVDTYVEPGLPADVSVVRVYGNFLEWDSGRPLSGVIQIRASVILKHTTSMQQVMPGVRKIRFRSDGFSMLLPATDDPQLLPNGWQYQARLTVRGTTQEFSFSLPSTPAEVNILSLIPAVV